MPLKQLTPLEISAIRRGVGASSGGASTTIVGITGTKAEYNTSLTDGDFVFVGDSIPYTLVTGLGTLATQNGTFSGVSSGTNTGDQTSIVGITGTKAQFNTALTDGDFFYVGDSISYTLVTGLGVLATLSAVDTTEILNGAVTQVKILDGAVSNAKLDTMAANTVKANATAGVASPTNVALAANRLLGRGSVGDIDAVTVDGTLAFTGAVLGATGTFTDTAFKLQDNGDPTKSLQFDAALITTGTTRTVQAPDTSGIMMVTATGKADTADIENLAVGTGKIADNAVLNGKLAQMATLTIKGNNTGVLADPKDLTATQTKNLLAITNTDVSGLGTLATQNGTFSGTSSGTNTGDQTSIVGITGTKAQFNAAVTDGDILYVGDITQYTDEQAQDAIGLMIDTSLVYVDATPLLQRAALTGDVTAAAGANATTLATVNANVGSFGLAASVSQFTVNAKGLITAAANVAISVLSTAISDSTAAGRAMLTAATAAAQTALLDIFTAGAKGLVPASGGGTTNFMRADGTWAAPGGGTSLSGTGTVILSTSAYEFEGDIAAVGVVPANKALVWLQTGTDQDENTADMLDLVTLAGIAGTNVITVKMQFSAPSSGPIKLNWSVF